MYSFVCIINQLLYFLQLQVCVVKRSSSTSVSVCLLCRQFRLLSPGGVNPPVLPSLQQMYPVSM